MFPFSAAGIHRSRRDSRRRYLGLRTLSLIIPGLAIRGLSIVVLLACTSPVSAFQLFATGSATTDTGLISYHRCNTNEINGCGGTPDGTAPFISGSISGDASFASSSADLRTGEIKARASSATPGQAGAQAGYLEILTLDLPGLLPGQVTSIGIEITVHGSYDIAAGFSFSAATPYPALAPVFDQLSIGVGYQNLTTGTDSTADPDRLFFINQTGDWDQLGPETFIGEIDIFGDDPTLFLQLFFEGGSNFDFSNTLGLSLLLPVGATFTSTSGVFLTGGGAIPVPEPATWLLLAAGVFLASTVVVQRRIAGAACFRQCPTS